MHVAGAVVLFPQLRRIAQCRIGGSENLDMDTSQLFLDGFTMARIFMTQASS